VSFGGLFQGSATAAAALRQQPRQPPMVGCCHGCCRSPRCCCGRLRGCCRVSDFLRGATAAATAANAAVRQQPQHCDSSRTRAGPPWWPGKRDVTPWHPTRLQRLDTINDRTSRDIPSHHAVPLSPLSPRGLSPSLWRFSREAPTLYASRQEKRQPHENRALPAEQDAISQLRAWSAGSAGSAGNEGTAAALTS
jgi:hypothetical protein